ncbi:MAG: L-rhamnose isomerase [Candidatus Aminicenantes bacterium]|nr:L-rhamnose isomerase [Candidatus Aminicenantes bacterium]
METDKKIELAYLIAKERYAEMGVNSDEVLKELAKISLSLPCWQGDDIRGFETFKISGDTSLLVTGNYPGRARNPEELRSDADKAFSLIPGRHRFNLQAIYGEFKGKRVDRDEISPEYFEGWIDWAKERKIGLDFNPTCFAHPYAADGFTLSHPAPIIRKFWIAHCVASRRISEVFGRELNNRAITNLWIPDGMKDTPVDRRGFRDRLEASLDEIYSVPMDNRFTLDSVEGKLFGLGSESFTVGSHEFYFGYAIKKQLHLTLDAGHFHPTESLADKISSVLRFLPGIVLHLSRGVRWDSDHVVILNDELKSIAQEIVRGNYLSKVHLALDFFDASVNRVAAWIIGARAVLKAFLLALLEPHERLKEMELAGDYTGRLALLEELNCHHFRAIWDYYCLINAVPPGLKWLEEIKRYETEIQRQRI